MSMQTRVSSENFARGAWLLTALTVILVFLSWLPNQDWSLRGLSVYRIFPVLGLLAFSLMWSHYIVAAARKVLDIPKESIKTYFDSTSLVVLAAILLHPGLFIVQLWRDGYGLPPGSYSSYVAPGLVWVIALGVVSLWVFLAYELRYWYGKRSWWRFVQYASDIAMAAIFYHALRLGTQLQGTWLRYVWFFYGISYVAALLVIYVYKPSKPQL